MKLDPQDRHRRRDRDADLLLVVQVLLLGFPERLPRHGQHVRADLATALDQLDQEEEGGDREDGAGEVEERAAGHRDLPGADRRQQRAGGDQHARPGQPRQVLRRQHRDGAEGDREQPAEQQPGAAEPGRGPRRVAEEQQPEPQHGVDADLAQDGEDRRGRAAGRGVGGRQPEAQGPHPRLDQEGDAQDGGTRLQQRPVLAGDGRDPLGQVGHVERARHAVEHAHADQEEQRGGQVDREVVQAGPDPRGPRAVQDQPVGSGQHDLEEHEEVEEVAGQEGAVEAHQLELEQRVEMPARAVPARQREHQRGQPQDGWSAPASARPGGPAPARCRTATASRPAGTRAPWRHPRRRPGAAARAPGRAAPAPRRGRARP